MLATKRHPVIENTGYSCPPISQSLRPSLRRAPKKRHPNEPIDYSLYLKGNQEFVNKKKRKTKQVKNVSDLKLLLVDLLRGYQPYHLRLFFVFFGRHTGFLYFASSFSANSLSSRICL